MEAWHFLPADRRLHYPPQTLVEPGQTLTVSLVDRPLALCEWGLHFSERALDALKYAPGPIVCRVVPGGDILAPAGEDKGCASERTCLWLADATTILHEFASWAAEQALLAERAAGREPDPRSWAAIAAKRAWLRGEIAAEQLSAARSAAESAAESTAWSAARSAAESAARSAARSAAWNAAQSNYNEELERRLLALARVVEQ